MGAGVRVRRVHSIAQREQAVGSRGGYARSGSFILQVGVGYDPVWWRGSWIDPPAEVASFQGGSWNWQPQSVSISVVRDFPNTSFVRSVLIQAYSREVISIDLR